MLHKKECALAHSRAGRGRLLHISIRASAHLKHVSAFYAIGNFIEISYCIKNTGYIFTRRPHSRYRSEYILCIVKFFISVFTPYCMPYRWQNTLLRLYRRRNMSEILISEQHPVIIEHAAGCLSELIEQIRNGQ